MLTVLEVSISIRCSKEERALFERAASEHNRRLSDWARRALLNAVRSPGEAPRSVPVSRETVVLPEVAVSKVFKGPDPK